MFAGQLLNPGWDNPDETEFTAWAGRKGARNEFRSTPRGLGATTRNPGSFGWRETVTRMAAVFPRLIQFKGSPRVPACYNSQASVRPWRRAEKDAKFGRSRGEICVDISERNHSSKFD
jgi:hypothetical protein